MDLNLSLADVIVMVGFSALVGLALGVAIWRPSRRERQEVADAIARQEDHREIRRALDDIDDLFGDDLYG